MLVFLRINKSNNILFNISLVFCITMYLSFSCRYSSRNVAASTSASDAPGCSGTKSNPNFEEAHKVQDGKVQDGKAVRCSPIRVLPFPIPIGGISLDSMVNDCGPLMQPLFYPHSSHPFWSHSQSICQEATMPTSSSNQSEPKNVNSIQVEGKDNQSVKSPAHHSVQIQEETSQHLDVEKHMSSAAVESGSSFCNSGRNPSESAGQAISESANNEGIFTHKENKLAEIHCLSPREVALNKFRLKRKDRCFEKKVRFSTISHSSYFVIVILSFVEPILSTEIVHTYRRTSRFLFDARRYLDLFLRLAKTLETFPNITIFALPFKL